MQKDFAAPEGRRFTVTAATTLVSQLGDFAFLLSATWLITFPASGCHSVSVPESIAHQYVMTLEDAPFSSDAYFVWSAMHLNQHECIAWGSGGGTLLPLQFFLCCCQNEFGGFCSRFGFHVLEVQHIESMFRQFLYQFCPVCFVAFAVRIGLTNLQ